MRLLAALLVLPAVAFSAPDPALEVPLEVATRLVTTAVSESVTLILGDSPCDERAIVLVGTRLDEATLKAIRQSSTAASALVDEVAVRHALDADTRRYLIGALIGLSHIGADYPAPAGPDADPAALQLILGFRRGIRIGIANYHKARRVAVTDAPVTECRHLPNEPPAASNKSVRP